MMPAVPSGLKALLIDLDGVLFVESRVIEGAAEALARIKAAGFCCRFATNTSTQTVRSLHKKVCDLGLPIERHEIISAPQAALSHLRASGASACCLLLGEDVRAEFAEIREVPLAQADHIVLGDIGDGMSPALLNDIFNRLMAGAQLVAVHKNRFWQTGSGLRMDIGGFVAALEYCTGRSAIVVGKPSPEFFRVALLEMGAVAAEVAMVGDDVDADIGGAQPLGIFAILTRTGKFRQAYVDACSVRPDLIIDSIRDLPSALGLAN